MPQNLTQKIIKNHLVGGQMKAGQAIALTINHTLTQDATGTLAYLQFEAMGLPQVKTELSVSFVDHNTLQTDFRNMDDHEYLRSVAAKYGILFSRAGNGICHQVFLERFARPGKTLLGSDSHTPTAGGMGELAIGAGGLDVAIAMGGGTFHLTMPKIVGVRLAGKLPPWVTAKDIILKILQRQSVKGGVGKVFEYYGEGAGSLTVTERATICNMGAELGATSSIFPSDQMTRAYLRAQQREDEWRELGRDKDSTYDEQIEINLSELEPLIACPHSPDNVRQVKEIAGLKVNQVAIGSCTNSSYSDLVSVARILKGKTVHPEVSLIIAPGSRQVFEMISRSGALTDLIAAGARILESACGPCIGVGQAPGTKAISLRSFNRNFQGRSGTLSAGVYLTSPETCAAAALSGKIKDPRELGSYHKIPLPDNFHIDDEMILKPADNPQEVKVKRGPNIKPLPLKEKLTGELRGSVLLKTADNITTDHIMPAGAKILPLRSNIPEIAKYVFTNVDKNFYARAKEKNGGFIVGGANYGQGSSREHAALAPMYLGIKAIIAKSFARIHRSNLINFGILPLEFSDNDYQRISLDDELIIKNILEELGREEFLTIKNTTQNYEFRVAHNLTPRQKEIIKAGGLLEFVRNKL